MKLVTTAAEVVEAISGATVCVFDTETSSLRPHADGRVLAGLGVKPLGGEGLYISFRHRDSKNARLSELKTICDALRGKTLIGHNVKFDLAVILQEGIDLSNERCVDTLVTTRLTYEDLPNYELERLGSSILKIEGAPEARRGLKSYMRKLGLKTYDQIPAEVIYEPYVENDLELAEQLYRHTLPLIEERGLNDLFELEVKLTRALFRMETRGVQLDMEFVRGKLEEIAALLEKFERRAHKQAGCDFNLASNDEIRDAFHALDVRSPVMTSGGKQGAPKESWAKDVLEKIKHPLAETIGRWRKADSARKFYEQLVENSDANGMLHPSFHQAGAKTGRFSCSKPNAQNIPRAKGKSGMGRTAIADIKQREEKRRRYAEAGRTQIAFDEELEEELADPLEAQLLGSVRGAFVARPDHLWLVADYQGIEMRVLADYANERAMIRAFELGLDVHKLNMLAVFGKLPNEDDPTYKWMRDAAKQLGFGLIYGMGVSLLAIETGVSKGEAEDFMEAFFARYPSVRSTIKRAQDTCRNLGYLKNRWGRRRYLSVEKLYKALNFAVQGTSADMFKYVIDELDEMIVSRLLAAFMLLNIHDEIIVEIPVDQALTTIPLILDKMVDVPMIQRVPIRVDASVTLGRWSEKTSISCLMCGGSGIVSDQAEDELLRALYEGNQKLLDAARARQCVICDGKGYDLSLVKKAIRESS